MKDEGTQGASPAMAGGLPTTEITTPAEALYVIGVMTSRASLAGVTLPDPPEAPDPQMCCGRGCTPCIYSYYYEAVGAWRDGAISRISPSAEGR